MKYLLILIATIGFSNLSAQEINIKKDLSDSNVLYVVNLADKSLELPNSDNILVNLKPDMIEHIHVIKSGSATEFEAYKDKNVEGVIVITLINTEETQDLFEALKKESGIEIISIKKEDADKEVKIRLSSSNKSNILYEVTIDGKAFRLDSNQEFLKDIDPDDIKSIDVIKGEEGLRNYDALDKDGVIVIRLKNNKSSKKLLKKLEKKTNNN